MFRLMLILALVVFSLFLILVPLNSASAGDSLYGWTLSDSSTDPLANMGPATSDTLTLYLWLYCARPVTGGISTSRFFIDAPTTQVYGFDPSPGVVNSGLSPTDLDLALPNCPQGSFLAGQLRVQDLSGGYEVCLGPEFPHELFRTYGCDLPTEPKSISMVGYRTGGLPPLCVIDSKFFYGPGCDPLTSVDSESWGRVKALYRPRPQRTPQAQ